MNTELNQKISQLLDDDLHLLEQQQILRKISKQDELLTKMNRYQAVSQVLQNKDFVLADNDFLSKINSALENEPTYSLSQSVTKKSESRFWQKTSFALAASVAVVSLLVSQQQLQVMDKKPVNNDFVVAQQQQVKIATHIPSPKLIEKQKEDQIAALQHERLKAYLQAHSNDLYTHGALNMQPYVPVRMAGFSQE